jgi:hypothetical protein
MPRSMRDRSGFTKEGCCLTMTEEADAQRRRPQFLRTHIKPELSLKGR